MPRSGPRWALHSGELRRSAEQRGSPAVTRDRALNPRLRSTETRQLVFVGPERPIYMSSPSPLRFGLAHVVAPPPAEQGLPSAAAGRSGFWAVEGLQRHRLA
jgi:hypothetical protein